MQKIYINLSWEVVSPSQNRMKGNEEKSCKVLPNLTNL
jgi:hypothetical protein